MHIVIYLYLWCRLRWSCVFKSVMLICFYFYFIYLLNLTSGDLRTKYKQARCCGPRSRDSLGTVQMVVVCGRRRKFTFRKSFHEWRSSLRAYRICVYKLHAKRWGFTNTKLWLACTSPHHANGILLMILRQNIKLNVVCELSENCGFKLMLMFLIAL